METSLVVHDIYPLRATTRRKAKRKTQDYLKISYAIDNGKPNIYVILYYLHSGVLTLTYEILDLCYN